MNLIELDQLNEELLKLKFFDINSNFSLEEDEFNNLMKNLNL